MGKLKIFNSLTKQKEVFHPNTNKKVGVYVCGITPYDITHLGHAFTYVFFDVLVRYLRSLGYKVTYVQNLTDMDDDILRRAKKLKKNWKEVVRVNTDRFLKDMKWLQNRKPDVYPRVTEHIKEIIAFVQRLRKTEPVYERRGSVYFHIDSYKDYRSLSRLSRKAMLPISIERGNDPKDPNKKDPLDFVLWQARKPGEPSWPSPWGRGRPGWHIECSAMSQKYLGKTIDIYGGGRDLEYPHHESSIAQSETANQKECARYWVHVGMLRYQGEKMSKSLGNMVFISDLKKKHSSNVVRILLLSHHYRFPWEFFDKDIEKAEKTSRLIEKAWSLPSSRGSKFNVLKYEKSFFCAMEDDINTKKAIMVLERLSKDMLKKKTMDLKEAKVFLNKAFSILGLKYGRA